MKDWAIAIIIVSLAILLVGAIVDSLGLVLMAFLLQTGALIMHIPTKSRKL